MIIPEFISLSDWAASLIIDFPNDNIPFLLDEKNWKEWGSLLLQESSFNRNDIPKPDGYQEWQPWAHSVFYTLANT
jgi:hypothetical protein